MHIMRPKRRGLCTIITVASLLCVVFCLHTYKSYIEVKQRRQKAKALQLPFWSGEKRNLSLLISPWDEPSRNKNLVVYNRVPKCASTTSRALFSTLQKQFQHRFSIYVESYPFIKEFLKENEQQQLVERLSSKRRPSLYIRHLRFIDFTKYALVKSLTMLITNFTTIYWQEIQMFNRLPPIYVNIIRDPVEQFISAYYFNRFGFEGWSETKIRKWLVPKGPQERFMSLEDCLRRNVTECIKRNPSRYLGFFCGQYDECSNDNENTLEKAKENVKQHFAVVGIVEDYQNTLTLLEYYLPRHFSGVSKVYDIMKYNNILSRSKTARKIEPSAETKKILKKALHFRVEFYNFIKQRFHEQLKAMAANLENRN